MENKKCLVELDAILNLLSEEDLNKIPVEIRSAIKEQKDKEYTWEYDDTKTLKEQNLNRKTIAMLAYLNMQYLVSSDQKELLEQIHSFNEQKSEKEKAKKYSSNDLFKERNNKENDNIEKGKNENVMLIQIKNDKWYHKIFSFFRTLFK